MVLIPTQEPVEWDSGDAQRLTEFFNSSTGKRFLQSLVNQGPALLDGADVNKTLVASGKVNGYTLALINALSLQTVQPTQPEPPSTTYPDLDNEAEWDPKDRTQPRA